MSTLSQFAGGGVKSIQRGTIVGTGVATISAVDPAKSFISSSCRSGYSTYGSGAVAHTSSIELTSPTQVSASNIYFGSGQNSIISWEVIELY